MDENIYNFRITYPSFEEADREEKAMKDFRNNQKRARDSIKKQKDKNPQINYNLEVFEDGH
ncbi:MAG: hypothetical protein KKF48_03190 [Nanoarchaeota archaeon]|nr:hypothetical protein [Nanoarchaeota archaeon]MBU1028028.1 hypothetical protein [Nanoarchaeota archaeon]